MSGDAVSGWVREHSGLMLIPMFGAIGAMLAVFWKRHSHPLNIILLGLFTVLEAITIGSVVSYYSDTVVLQALVITTFVFVRSRPQSASSAALTQPTPQVGLTLFTFQVSPCAFAEVHLAHCSLSRASTTSATWAATSSPVCCASSYVRLAKRRAKLILSVRTDDWHRRHLPAVQPCHGHAHGRRWLRALQPVHRESPLVSG